MTRVVAFCAGRPRPRIGAHPSYPDRAGFGRTTIDIAPEVLRESIVEQCAALAKIAGAHGRRVEYVKPHGALYHDAAQDVGLAAAVLVGARLALGTDVTIIGPPRGVLREAAGQLGFAYLREGFADRATRPDGTLVPRSEPGALLPEPRRAAARARELVGQVDTICVHADTPGSLAVARVVRDALDHQGG